jgi:hypothetical protein
MYRILFFDEIVLLSCIYCILLSDLNSNQKLTRKDYEAIRDENADPLDVRERANYYEYVCCELPCLVKSRLESVVSLRFQTLVSVLDEIIQSCID